MQMREHFCPIVLMQFIHFLFLNIVTREYIFFPAQLQRGAVIE